MAALTREQQIKALEASQLAHAQKQPGFLSNIGNAFAGYPEGIQNILGNIFLNKAMGGLGPVEPNPEETPVTPESWAQREQFRQQYAQEMPRDAYDTKMLLDQGPMGKNIFDPLNMPRSSGISDNGKPVMLPSWGQQITNLSRESAQNNAQKAKDASAQQQANYDSSLKYFQGQVGEAQKKAAALGFGSIGKDGKYQEGDGSLSSFMQNVGFKPDQKRRYTTEKDAAGNIIKITPLAKAGEDSLATAAAKGWTAPGSEGGPGNPFTPNLTKFMARQNPESLALAKANEEAYMQSKRNLGALAVEAKKYEQEQSRENIKKIQDQANKGVTSSSVPVDTTAAAQAAMNKGKDVANQNWQAAETNYDAAAALQKAQRDETYKPGANSSSMKAYGLAKMAQSARDAAQKQMGTAQQGLQQGAKQSAELASVPKTTVNVLNTPYGQAYSTPGTQANENKAVDIVKKNKNKPQTT